MNSASAQPVPELATGRIAKPVLEARRHMIVAANPRAADAGYAVLQRGGSALDAAIAAQMVLNVVEPQSSGVGGGGFLLHYSARDQRLRVYDGRETAPAAADPNLFVDVSGVPFGYLRAIVGGRSVGVPGLVAMLELAHRRHGKLAWTGLFAPAIDLAREGFPVSPRLAALVARDPALSRNAQARAVFFDTEGRPLAAGAQLRNPALAESLIAIAQRGARALRDGPLAEAIVGSVQDHEENPGRLTLADLQAYRPIEREPVCAIVHARRVCGVPPPSSGGIGVLQILRLLEDRSLDALDPDGLMAAHLYAEASRLAYADRDRFIADPAFARIPTQALLDRRYIVDRRARIDARRSMGVAQPGFITRNGPSGVSPEMEATTHLSVVDARGDIVALTSTIESAFGARLMAAGILLNNQLTDFSFSARDERGTIANRVEPGKRPRSSMSPVIVFDQSGRPILVLGSPGGPLIIGYVARTLLGVIAHGRGLQAAIEAPHIANRNGRTDLERGTNAVNLATGLTLLGHETRVTDMTSGLHGFERVRGARGEWQWRSGIDPRREGAARGD